MTVVIITDDNEVITKKNVFDYTIWGQEDIDEWLQEFHKSELNLIDTEAFSDEIKARAGNADAIWTAEDFLCECDEVWSGMI